MTTQQKIEQLRTNNERLYMCGGAKAVEKQHAKHKYTARERISLRRLPVCREPGSRSMPRRFSLTSSSSSPSSLSEVYTVTTAAPPSGPIRADPSSSR